MADIVAEAEQSPTTEPVGARMRPTPREDGRIVAQCVMQAVPSGGLATMRFELREFLAEQMLGGLSQQRRSDVTLMNTLNQRHVQVSEEIRATYTRTQGEVDAILGDGYAYARTKEQVFVIGTEDHLTARVQVVARLLADGEASCEKIVAGW